MTASPTDDLASAERRIQELTKELLEAREQQAATAEILAAISNLPSDPYRVFAEIAVSAARLCDAYDASIFQVNGDVLRVVAHHGPIPHPRGPGPPSIPIMRGVFNGRAVLDQQTIQVRDLQAETDQYPHEHPQQLREQSRTYSITSLAWASRIGGISRPTAFATPRLIAST